ncbi:MAG: CapA family protein [Labilithrix sp.]|nr:CapA family protein [Labilithrix sp.]
MRARSLFAPVPPLLFTGAAACTAAGEDDGDDLDLDGEPAEAESAIVPITQPDETAPASSLAPAPLKSSESSLIDVRGVGDAAWSKTHERTPLSAAFGAALDRFDATGQSYRGDLSFINWETVVGSDCTQFASPYVRGRSYAFVSRPENLTQAYERGFNLVALSNNHTRDCHASTETTARGEGASVAMTARAIEGLGDLAWLTAGVAGTGEDDSARAKVRTFTIKGREVRVAFGSLYTGRASCPRAACSGDARALFESLRDAPADLRVLAAHSMAAADQDELVRKSIEFVERYGGDVVFGHGPHVWKPVRVVKKSSGGKGVIFESLGNFLHPSLAAQSRNFIGRALFDPETLSLRQVQLIPVANAGMDVRLSTADAGAVASNLRWTRMEGSTPAVYANVAP